MRVTSLLVYLGKLNDLQQQLEEAVSIPKATVDILKDQVFSFDTFFVTSHEPYEVSISDAIVYLHVHTADFVTYSNEISISLASCNLLFTNRVYEVASMLEPICGDMTRHAIGPNQPNILT